MLTLLYFRFMRRDPNSAAFMIPMAIDVLIFLIVAYTWATP
jgi:hypothetical protein